MPEGNIDTGIRVEAPKPHIQRVYENLSVLPVLELIPPKTSSEKTPGEMRNDLLEEKARLFHEARKGLAVLQAYGMTKGQSNEERLEISEFSIKVMDYLSAFSGAKTGILAPLDVDRFANKYISEEMVERLYGGNEPRKIIIDNDEHMQNLRNIAASIIAHDIRTPITSILGRSQLIQRAERAGRPIAQDSLPNILHSTVQLGEEAVNGQELLEDPFEVEPFTASQIEEQCKLYLGENVVIHIAEDTEGKRIPASKKWFERFLKNIERNMGRQYEVRDEKYPQRADETDFDGKTKGRIMVTLDTDPTNPTGMRMTIDDVATGFPPKRLKEKFVKRGTDHADRGGTGVAMAECTAVADKLFNKAKITPKTIVRDKTGNIIKMIHGEEERMFDKDGNQSVKLIETTFENGEEKQREITDEEAEVGNEAFSGARIQVDWYRGLAA